MLLTEEVLIILRCILCYIDIISELTGCPSFLSVLGKCLQLWPRLGCFPHALIVVVCKKMYTPRDIRIGRVIMQRRECCCSEFTVIDSYPWRGITGDTILGRSPYVDHSLFLGEEGITYSVSRHKYSCIKGSNCDMVFHQHKGMYGYESGLNK